MVNWDAALVVDPRRGPIRVVLAEKPSVARELATFLWASARREGYFECQADQVTWAFGHLVTLNEPDDYDPALKRWSLATLPFIPERFGLKIIEEKGAAQQFAVIKRLLRAADEVVCATDAGREGEPIFRYIQELAGATGKPASRLWLNALTAAAIRLKVARDALGEEVFAGRLDTLQKRLIDLAIAEYSHAYARRLAKRLEKYWEALLLFVERKDVPSSNNKGEREIRPAVLMRKASYGSGSDLGAATRSVLMSIYRTLKQRGVDALAATEAALRTYIATGKLPPLPTKATSLD